MARLLCTLTLAALVAVGCGGSDDDGGGSGRTVDVPANGAVTVKAKEYSFDPQTIVVGGAGRLRITLDNDGLLAHDIRVREGDRDLGGTPSFPAGEQRRATVNLPHGRYEFLCTVGDHAELGMRGSLVVK
jgi:plastocyanin